MSLTLKPRVFLIGFLPGFLFICGIILANQEFDFNQILNQANDITLIIGIAIIILSFIIGQVFDSVRECGIEKYFEHKYKNCKSKDKQDINWDFFYDAMEKDIDKLDNNYYLFYVLNFDLSICLLFLILYFPFWIVFSSCKLDSSTIKSIMIFITIYGASILLLVLDALELRKEIARHTNKSSNDKTTPTH